MRSAAERAGEAEASARQGLHTLSQISTLLLIAAALAVAAALSATVWQRRARLASLKIQGYNPGQLWRGLLLESGVMLGVGSLAGAIVGIYGHALAGHWLTITTGLPRAVLGGRDPSVPDSRAHHHHRPRGDRAAGHGRGACPGLRQPAGVSLLHGLAAGAQSYPCGSRNT